MFAGGRSFAAYSYCLVARYPFGDGCTGTPGFWHPRLLAPQVFVSFVSNFTSLSNCSSILPMQFPRFQLARTKTGASPLAAAVPPKWNWVARRSWVATWILAVGLSGFSIVSAQPPGTQPPGTQPPGTQPPGTESPQGVVAPSASQPASPTEVTSQRELPIKAFMFQSESSNLVMMPGMSWEELQRLQNLDAGTEAPSQAYSYQLLEVTGTASEQRAELEVTLRLSIESTGDRRVAIPLAMGNFFLLAPPDVTGVEHYSMTLSHDGAGYLLWVKTNARRDATLRMKVSARVGETSARSLDFRLPDVPSTVRLIAEASNVVGDVVGRGYETIESKALAGGRTEFLVESGGGTFTLRWGGLQRKSDEAPLLEVTSRVNVRWNSPQEAPRASVQLTVRNVRNAIDAFEIRLPAGSIVPDTASLGAGGRSVTFGPPIPDSLGERRQILIPEQERQQRIDLNFNFNLRRPSGNLSADNPLALRVPEVVDAIRHRGEITMETSDDYRLRWRSEPWVRSVLGEAGDAAESGRSYSFQFDRSSFTLPLWLSAKERQVRIGVKSRISFRDTTAILEMLIRSSGRASDGRGPQIDMADWKLQSIENAETDEPMDSFQGEGYPEIDFPSGNGEPPPVRIRAEYAIDSEEKMIVIPIPRVVQTDSRLLAPTSTVDVVNSGRSVLVVDLEMSENLERIMPAVSESNSDSTISSFRVDSQEVTATLVGTMVEQPPRITLASDGMISLDGDRLQTTIDWTVISRLDLEGRLPIRIPSVASPTDDLVGPPGLESREPAGRVVNGETGEASDETGGKSDLNDGSALAKQWNVSVNGVPAALQEVGNGRFDLISDRLANDTMSIRWHRSDSFNPPTAGESIKELALPRPAIEDVTVRGTVRIALRGNQQTEVLSATSPSADELVFDSLPPDPVRLRFRPRDTVREELSVRQLVLRTAVGHAVRHEQVLAKIHGGESFKVALPAAATGVSVEAYIDDMRVDVRRDRGTLIVPLPGDQKSHVLDLRVWVSETSRWSVAKIEPMLELPVGLGRIYWQIVVPLDSHVVWASPTLGRSMTWDFARWKLGRSPSHNDRELTAMVGASPHAMPPGNSYLYIGSDVRSFRTLFASRVVLWVVVGSLVLLTSIVLTYLPHTRHPLTAVAGAVFFAGLLAIAPDAAVLAGQLGIIALVLVIVMIAVRALVTPQRSDRIVKWRDFPRRSEVSTQSLLAPSSRERRSSVSRTEALPPPTEAPL